MIVTHNDAVSIDLARECTVLNELEQIMGESPNRKLASEFRTYHRFTPGLYSRTVILEDGESCVSLIHKTEHQFAILSGVAVIWSPPAKLAGCPVALPRSDARWRPEGRQGAFACDLGNLPSDRQDGHRRDRKGFVRMSGIALGLGAVSIGLTAYGAIESSKAANTAASVDNATAAFNARIDTENAEQIDLDTLQNIDTERQADATYLSREAAGYAASGVSATTGSALRAQITNVGRMTQQIQQQYQKSQIQQNNLYEAAQVGIAEGSAAASADTAAGTLASYRAVRKLRGRRSGLQHGLFNFASTPAPGSTTTAGVNQLF